MFIWIVLALVAVIVLYLIITYNGLVSLRNRIENAWAQIDVQLKRRYDLIPNLVETVKGYATHERETLERVVQARGAAVNAKGEPFSAETLLMTLVFCQHQMLSLLIKQFRK